MFRRKKTAVFDRAAKGKKLLREARRNIGAAWRQLEEMRIVLQVARRRNKKAPLR